MTCWTVGVLQICNFWQCLW